jgi:hypothetical protein
MTLMEGVVPLLTRGAIIQRNWTRLECSPARQQGDVLI